MEGLLRLSERIAALVTWIGRAAAWLAIAMMLVIIADVILRRYFVIGSTKLQELEWHLHGMLFLLCLGYAYIKGTHVRIDLLRERFSVRAKAWIELLGILFFLLPYIAAILYFGIDYVEMSYDNNEVSAALTGLPYRWIIKAMLLAGFALLGLAAIEKLLKSVVFLFGPSNLQALARLDNEESAQQQIG